MSDPIAEAAAQPSDAAPSSTESIQAPEVAQVGEQGAVTASSPETSSATSAPTSPKLSIENSASGDVPVPDADHTPEQRADAWNAMGNVQATVASDAAVARGGISDTTSAALVESESIPVAGDAGSSSVTADLPNAAATSPAGVATPASTGNVLLNATPVVGAPELAAAALLASQQHAAVMDQMYQQAMSTGQIDPTLAEQSQKSNATLMAAGKALADAAPLPRESHLMLLEHKLAAMYAKFKTGERIVIDEFEQILAHIKAVI